MGQGAFRTRSAATGADGQYTDASGATYTFHPDVPGADSDLVRAEATFDGTQWVGGWLILHDGVGGALFEPGPAAARFAGSLQGSVAAPQDIRAGRVIVDGVGTFAPVQVLPSAVGLI